MKLYKISIANRKNIGAIIITSEGKLLKKRVYKITDEDKLSNFYFTLMDTFEQGLRELQYLLYQNTDNESVKVIFEVNNNAFIKWVKMGYAKDEYNDYFMVIMNKLHSIPIMYDFSYQQRTFAYPYTHEKFLTKENRITTDINTTIEDKTVALASTDNSSAILIKPTKLSGVDSLLAVN